MVVSFFTCIFFELHVLTLCLDTFVPADHAALLSSFSGNASDVEALLKKEVERTDFDPLVRVRVREKKPKRSRPEGSS